MGEAKEVIVFLVLARIKHVLTKASDYITILWNVLNKQKGWSLEDRKLR